MVGFLFFGMGIAVSFLFVVKRTSVVTERVVCLKALAGVGFVVSGVFFYAENTFADAYLGAFTVVGGVFGLLGDIALDLKYLFPDISERCTRCGFYSFLTGHVFYCTSMVCTYGMKPVNWVCAALGAGFGFISVFLTEKIMKLKYGNMKKISILYSVVLCTALGLAGGYTITEHYTLHSILLNLGFLMFVISDGFLANIYFSVDEKERCKRSSIVLNHTTYYAAQYIIALSLAFFRG